MFLGVLGVFSVRDARLFVMRGRAQRVFLPRFGTFYLEDLPPFRCVWIGSSWIVFVHVWPGASFTPLRSIMYSWFDKLTVNHHGSDARHSFCGVEQFGLGFSSSKAQNQPLMLLFLLDTRWRVDYDFTNSYIGRLLVQCVGMVRIVRDLSRKLHCQK